MFRDLFVVDIFVALYFLVRLLDCCALSFARYASAGLNRRRAKITKMAL